MPGPGPALLHARAVLERSVHDLLHGMLHGLLQSRRASVRTDPCARSAGQRCGCLGRSCLVPRSRERQLGLAEILVSRLRKRWLGEPDCESGGWVKVAHDPGRESGGWAGVEILVSRLRKRWLGEPDCESGGWVKVAHDPGRESGGWAGVESLGSRLRKRWLGGGRPRERIPSRSG